MNRHHLPAALFFEIVFCAILLGVPAQPQLLKSSASFDTPQSFVSELNRLRDTLVQPAAAERVAHLPDEWVVHTSEGKYSVSTLPLRATLENRSEAQKWLTALAAEVQSYVLSPPAPGGAGAAMRRILAQPEFEKDRPPSEWTRLMQRLGVRLRRWLQQFFDFAEKNPSTSQALFWLLVIAAAAVGISYLYKWRQRRRYHLGFTGQPGPLPERTGQRWLANARLSATQGDLRQAIQLCYWGAVARLQDSHTLPQAHALTPREYLKLLPTGDAARKPLQSLTGQLEHFWYAGATPTPDDFAGTLKSLEEIGCPLA